MNAKQIWKAERVPSIRSSEEIEACIVSVRLAEYNHGRQCGAAAIRRQLNEYGVRPMPSTSKINRILAVKAMTNGRIGEYQRTYYEGRVK
jgi:hypothetical protein